MLVNDRKMYLSENQQRGALPKNYPTINRK